MTTILEYTIKLYYKACVWGSEQIVFVREVSDGMHYVLSDIEEC